FLGNGLATEFLGLTWQLVGEHWLHSPPFAYCGSIGPTNPSPELRQRFDRIGAILWQDFRLRGIFGIDCIVRDDQLWLIEVTPRYAASVEVLEYALDTLFLHDYPPIFAAAVQVKCRANSERVSETVDLMPRSIGPPIIGKAILFAREHLVFPCD